MRRFYKLSGGGNDFIAMAEPSGEPTAREVAAWCRRGSSVGADGLFVIERQSDGVRMRHFNSDGGPAALCLNGTRCAARLAFELGWAEGSTRVATDVGSFEARDADPATVELSIPRPDAAARRLELRTAESTWDVWHLVVGVPHLVLFWEGDMSRAPVETLGAELRHHPDLGPDGANVDFVAFPSSAEMEIRSYERGVEAETLACGTGVLASTALALQKGMARLPLEALTKGGFRIEIAPGEREDLWRMRGDARVVAEGSLHSGADEAPEAPAW